MTGVLKSAATARAHTRFGGWSARHSANITGLRWRTQGRGGGAGPGGTSIYAVVSPRLCHGQLWVCAMTSPGSVWFKAPVISANPVVMVSPKDFHVQTTGDHLPLPHLSPLQWLTTLTLGLSRQVDA